MTGASGVTPVPPVSRVLGLGSVLAKTLRDSRRATMIVGGAIGLLTIVVAAGIISQFATAAARTEIRNIVDAVPPILRGLAGRPVNVETLGGYLQYKYGGFFPLVTGLWSILALSGTLAAESSRGSLDIVAAAPISRRQIAIQKVTGHVLMMTVAMLVIGGATAVAGSAFASLPGDAISAAAAFSYALWLGLMALIAGSAAFALGPFVGRGSAAGIAGALMLGGFLLNGYQEAIPHLAPAASLSWFAWTANHLPLAGRYDWPSIALVGLVTIALLAVGIEAFARRDIGATSAIPGPRLPRALLGLRGPIGRASSERLPTALGWGLGLGAFGLIIASSGGAFIEQIAKSPDFTKAIEGLFPGTNIGTIGGFLELVFIEFGLVLAGLAAAALVGGWAADERSGRDEMLLAAPLPHTRWPLAGAMGVLGAIAVIVVLTAAGIAIGTVTAGGEPAAPVAGTLAIGLYAAAMAGVGIAVGGLVGPGFAAATVAGLTIVTWLIDLVGGDIGLPDAVRQLALSTHMGQPMLGTWDPVGIVACAVLAIGGTALGTWGFARRDLGS
jgi:ABC-type transport system involved in multi-copper enzyme maturation permease subunit